ncbi:MAG: hypothetical protein NC086_00065 [Alistipes sp.]|nr:hypothetical protein [Alistipes sp.]
MRNRLRLILLGVFCAGVLLTGIGAGIAIVEYTSLEYTGVHVLNGETVKEDYEFKVEPVEGEKVIIKDYRGMVELVYDQTVPVNTVRCTVQSNPDIEKIRIKVEGNKNTGTDDNIRNTWIYISGSYVGNDFDLLMQNKDFILAELKAGRIGTYTVENPIKEITVRVNPEMEGIVGLEGWW